MHQIIIMQKIFKRQNPFRFPLWFVTPKYFWNYDSVSYTKWKLFIFTLDAAIRFTAAVCKYAHGMSIYTFFFGWVLFSVSYSGDHIQIVSYISLRNARSESDLMV